jgi:hypothetical protein
MSSDEEVQVENAHKHHWLDPGAKKAIRVGDKFQAMIPTLVEKQKDKKRRAADGDCYVGEERCDDEHKQMNESNQKRPRTEQ